MNWANAAKTSGRSRGGSRGGGKSIAWSKWQEDVGRLLQEAESGRSARTGVAELARDGAALPGGAGGSRRLGAAARSTAAAARPDRRAGFGTRHGSAAVARLRSGSLQDRRRPRSAARAAQGVSESRGRVPSGQAVRDGSARHPPARRRPVTTICCPADRTSSSLKSTTPGPTIRRSRKIASKCSSGSPRSRRSWPTGASWRRPCGDCSTRKRPNSIR